MKTYVITLSKTFPKGHIRAGEPTNFAHLLGNGLNLTHEGLQLCKHKIHTIRANYDLWAKRFEDIQRGEACLSVRQWSGKPYNSPQVEIARLTREDGIGIQKIDVLDAGRFEIDHQIFEEMALNDGLSYPDWYSWIGKDIFKKPMAIIHFTKFRY